MNKIVINKKQLVSTLDDAVILQFKVATPEYPVSLLTIDIIKDTTLLLELRSALKLNITINVKAKTKAIIKEYKLGSKAKLETTFNLATASEVLFNKFNHSKGNREVLYVNLNGEQAKITSHFKTISYLPEKYDMMISHKAPKTISDITNQGVNVGAGSLIFNVTSDVANNLNDCLLNQANRIINYTDNECSIKPILLIGENDVEASHSALIGSFSDDELFYLMSRGLTRKMALNLLTMGLILSDLDMVEYEPQIKRIITRYGGQYES